MNRMPSAPAAPATEAPRRRGPQWPAAVAGAALAALAALLAGLASWALAVPALHTLALLLALAGLAGCAAAAGWWAARARAAEQVPAPAAADRVPEAAAAAPPDDTATLVHILSHDLRAPLRVVDGFARIVKEDYGRALDRIGHDHLDRVLAASARMNQMIDALLAQARLAQAPMAHRPVDLSRLATDVVDELRRAEPARAAEVVIEPGLVAQGDPALLRQLLENLLGNAWKYSARAQPSRIAFERDPAEPQGFVVRDNGAGFDMRFADRLFGLFQRLHSASDYPGTGIGLASVQRIVQRHGGHIRAEGEVGQGARFHFTLS